MTLQFKRAFLAVAVGVFFLFTLPGFADSQARIVRLSDVEGNVQIDRHTGQGFENAILNMPITQGMLLQTGSDGRAEVEFEDGTVVRLVPDSELDFSQLSLQDSGDKVSTIEVRHGTAYFNVNHKGDDHFTVAFADRELPVSKSSHFRVALGDSGAKIAVFNGELWLNGEGDKVKVKKGEELTLNLVDDSNYLAKDIEPEEFDQWDKDRSGYHQQYYADSAYDSYPYYGRGDLNYYGGWYNVPGYGMMWQPAGYSYGWDPFMNGYWCWYPGFGYTWVSGYPWGWLPYRYGSWAYVSGWGWGWRPGRHWNYWTPIPPVVNPPSGFDRPHHPDPVNPRHPTVIVGGGTGPHHPPAGPGRFRGGDDASGPHKPSGIMPHGQPPVVGYAPTVATPHVLNRAISPTDSDLTGTSQAGDRDRPRNPRSGTVIVAPRNAGPTGAPVAPKDDVAERTPRVGPRNSGPTNVTPPAPKVDPPRVAPSPRVTPREAPAPRPSSSFRSEGAAHSGGASMGHVSSGGGGASMGHTSSAGGGHAGGGRSH